MYLFIVPLYHYTKITLCVGGVCACVWVSDGSGMSGGQD